MKVTQIRVAGQAAWPHLTLPSLSPDLNVIYGPPRTGKSTVAHLAAHLLYGKADSPWRQQFAQMPPMAEGAIDVESAQGRFVLRRHRDGSQLGRLTVASASGAPVDNHTIRTLLGGIAPTLLAELFNVDFAEGPQAKTLLEGEFARQFTQAIAQEHVDLAVAGPVCDEHASIAVGQIDRRRVDELVRRRDEVVRQIESQMSERRRGSTAIAQEIATVEDALSKRRVEADELATRLHAVESKLAETAARLRYFSLETVVRPVAPGDAEARQEALDRLDQEVSRCRQMLSDLQSRESTVRRELAEVHPDGAADSVGSLAEQRATVGVLERLLNDLDAEVAGLARSHEPGRCIAADAHTRMLPVAQLLRQQLYSLCGQVTEQERAVRRRQLRVEMRQLSRAQSDLSDQLEHLLERRQTHVYEAQLSGRVSATLPQAPAAGHCQCDRHDDFLRNGESLITGRGGRARHEDDVRTERSDLEAQLQKLRQASDQLMQEMADLTARWERLQQDRTQACERISLDDLRGELDRLESEIQRTLQSPVIPFAPVGVAGARRRPWKASDVLAQLTGGELTQIRLSREGRAATIVDRAGRLLVVEDLTLAQNDQLYVALLLALTSSLASRGLDLPLVLDEPFLRQDPAAAAAMASVLAEYARQGRQTLVFTENREALRHFESLGVAVHDIDALRRRDVPTAPAVAAPTAATVRIVRETIGENGRSLKSNVERPAPILDRAIEKPTYYLTADATIADFPVLGNETLSVFSSLGVRTIEDLLAADGDEVVRRLAHPAVSAEAVRLWQQHTSLMCFVPGVSLADAQVLAACEVTSPEALFNIDVRLLAEAVARFLDTERGRRFATSRDRFTRDRLALLQKYARRQRDRWQLLSPRYAWVERTVEPIKRRVKPEIRPKRARQAPAATTPRIAHQTKRPHATPLRFFLDLSSAVADAPSIGAKTAERLAQVGVRSVADLLNINPESTAEELGVRHITAATLAGWQSQARLACRIPELRSAGAQILVGCGFTEPEQIAAANLSELTRRVDAFCRTTEGQRLLRGGDAPSASRIAAWVQHAAQMRPLEAA